MTLLGIGIGWLWKLLWRMWRKGGGAVTPGVPLPAWPRGASAIVHLLDVRIEEKKDEVKRMPSLGLVLRRDDAGTLRDGKGRELITAAVHTKRNVASWWERLWRQEATVHVSELRQSPEAILRALSGEILAGQMITLLFVDERLFSKQSKQEGLYQREGIAFIDAACALIDPGEDWPDAVVEKAVDATELVAA